MNDLLPRRFWNKVEPEPNSGCWLWIGAITSDGYGSYWSSKLQGAHRVSFKAHVGPIPFDKEVDHLCHVRSCVNPNHLRLVTHYVNVSQAPRAKATHCHNGHLYSLEIGKESCRACNNWRYRQIRQS